MPGQRKDAAGRIGELGSAGHLHVAGIPPEIEGVGPDFLVLGHAMDPVPEEEQFARPVIPAGVRRKHVVFFPGIGRDAERGETAVRVIGQAARLDEDRVREHVDLVREREQLDLGVVRAGLALDNLPVLVLHGAAVLEDGHAVAGVVVQETGTEHVMVLVLQLHERTPELREVAVDEIRQVVAGQDRLLLEDPDIADGFDLLPVHVPVGRVADQVGVVMQETGRARDFPVIAAVPLHQFHFLGAHQAHQRIRPLRFDLGGQIEDAGQSQQEKQEKPFPHYCSALLRATSFQPSRVKSQSAKIGSI